jgi:hypothetical protein
MSLAKHFFASNFCEHNIRYCLAWVFFFGTICLVSSIVIIDPQKLNYGNTVKILFILFLTCVVSCISRLMCYKKEEIHNMLPFNPDYYHTTISI